MSHGKREVNFLEQPETTAGMTTLAVPKWGDLEGKVVSGVVSRVYDGDTVHILAPVGEAGGVYDVTCRLEGIDAPELHRGGGGGETSRDTLTSILAETDNKVLSGGPAAQTLKDRGFDPAPMSPEDFGKYLRAEVARWAKAVKQYDVKSTD